MHQIIGFFVAKDQVLTSFLEETMNISGKETTGLHYQQIPWEESMNYFICLNIDKLKREKLNCFFCWCLVNTAMLDLVKTFKMRSNAGKLVQ